ncbi:MAG: hypothetical protein JWN99_1252 [Ilumatobacteraceae bacterium]|nr:hypothetical protein [Ilumatobacteraceae bacterium]
MDDTTPEEVEQLARSLAMSSSLTNSGRLRVIELLRLLIAFLRGGR